MTDAYGRCRRETAIFFMTTVDIVLRYATAPTEAMTFALANMREVYGIRRLLLRSRGAYPAGGV